ncbi:hypothetical protein BDY19DRAFT_1089864 [Irpex rosettiformis]|uniref:Uncharacterized protein n=1 Tax=Irpex rosettiformis TaxID=378272 RepID=A0ACB8U2S7_9APHY|nr:hypothetical protein BDY19DRAFT_1089864 [Irpex rosettiformis]
MALTAISPTTLPHETVWDEAIVPALRKRLESESLALSKRMSAASITSNEDLLQSGLSSNASFVSRDRQTSPTYHSPKPSAIPRPSLQQSRPAEASTSATGRSSRSSSFQRNRALSQPFLLDRPPTSNSSHAHTDSYSQLASPMIAKSTRIPVPRNRTTSVSSGKQSLNGSASTARSETRNGPAKVNTQPFQLHSDLGPDLWPVNEYGQVSSVASRTTLRIPRSQDPELVHERPPFNANSVSSRSAYEEDYPRMSTESEERPFEHWYRGDVSRNGGVGELRVGRRQEMLDIANYGYSLREAPSHTTLNRSRSNSRGRDYKASPSHRPRAESLGARESIYIDDDSRIHQGSMVLDEHPLTDLDSDGEDYDALDYYTNGVGDEEVSTPPVAPMDRSDTPSTLVEPSKSSNSTFKSRIPTPTPRQISEQSRAETPTQRAPTISPEPATPKASAVLQSQSQPQLTVNTAAADKTGSNNKRRAKSPASAVTSTKKSRTKSPAPKPKVQPRKKEEVRGSVAQYPTIEGIEGDDLSHAIPTWTQPAPPPSGNWDDAVLPVVARKQGLEGHYIQADGKPKPPRLQDHIPEPAPGTFGFRYRSSQNSTPVDDVAMDEFGQRAAVIQIEKEDSRPSESETLAAPPSPQPPVPRATYSDSDRTDSPAPFSQYPPTPLPEIQITRPSNDVQKFAEEQDEEKSGGCCKCVIM